MSINKKMAHTHHNDAVTSAHNTIQHLWCISHVNFMYEYEMKFVPVLIIFIVNVTLSERHLGSAS